MFLAEISDKSVTTQISPVDLDFLTSSTHVLGGYVARTSKATYDRAALEIQSMEQAQQQANDRLQQEKLQSAEVQQDANENQKKVNSPFFGLHGKSYKETVEQRVEADQEALSKDQVAISADEASISDYIQKKSAQDQLVAYDGQYLSLTPAGVVMLNALNCRMTRVSDMEFSDFVQEIDTTEAELQGIADRASTFVSEIRNRTFIPDDTGNQNLDR